MKIKINIQLLSYLIFISIVLSFSLSCNSKSQKITEKSISDDNVITISFDQRRDIEEDVLSYLSLIKYLERETPYSFKLILPSQKNYKDNYPLNEHIDIAIVGAYNAIEGIEKKWRVIVKGYSKNMKTSYRSALIVPNGSNIKSINDIKGKMIAFGDSHSTQGYLIPRIEMEILGIKMNDLSCYKCTGSHSNCLHSVYDGEYDAGFLQDILAEKRADQGIVKIVWYSDYYPSSCIIVSPSLNDTIISIIKQTLIDLKPLSDDSLILYKWNGTEMAGGFADGYNDDYNKISKWAKKLDILE